MKTEDVARLAIEHIQLRTEVQLLQKEHDIALREQQVKMQMAELKRERSSRVAELQNVHSAW